MKKVPWDQHSPYALKRDSDHDGISDALDNHVGPGANPPSFLKRLCHNKWLIFDEK